MERLPTLPRKRLLALSRFKNGKSNSESRCGCACSRSCEALSRLWCFGVAMRVVCCYCNIKPQTAKALKLYAPECEYVDTSATIWDYGKAIASRWTGEDDLVIIEDDKEITAEVLPSFQSCGCLWCSYRYLIYPEGHQRLI